ncbi:MAG: (Fe-S)-binding protein [Bacilli bacterium]|jgi:electron transport complex protein RnfB
MLLDILLAAGIMLAIGALLGLALAFASLKLTIKVDPRFETVVNMLPGLNCGVCGHPGCAGMATSLLDGSEKKVSSCRPSKPEQREKIRDYLNNAPGPDGKIVKVEI